MSEDTHVPWMSEAVHRTLSPGESVSAMFEFRSFDDPGSSRLLVLTNRNLRLIKFAERHWRQRKEAPRDTVGTSLIPLDRISGLNVEVKRDSRGRTLAVMMSFWWEGHREHFGAADSAALQFAVALEASLGVSHPSSAATSVAEELDKLSHLANQGILTPDEFARAKELFLGKPPDARSEAISLLQNLHGLYRSRVISESEFNMKKWEILSRPGF